jgi:hypothetical protein
MPIKSITKVDTGLERRILIGMIMDKKFIARIIHNFKPEWLTPYGRTIATWVIDYYNT